MLPIKPTNLELMLATMSPPFSSERYAAELKFDGYRALVAKDGPTVQILSRNKRDLTTKFPKLVAPLLTLKGSFIIDAEICALDERGIPDFERMRKMAANPRSPQSQPHLYAFDILFSGKRDLRTKPYLARKASLNHLIGGGNSTIHYVDYIEDNNVAVYKAAVQLGMEGIVAKLKTSTYVAGRSRDWLKIKRPNWHDGFKRRR